jgi:phage shock protein C
MRDDGAMTNVNGSKVLVRRRDNRIIAGVCAGLADYSGIDVNLIRVVVAVVSVFTGGMGVLAYLAGWIVIPEEGQASSIAEDLINKNRQN